MRAFSAALFVLMLSALVQAEPRLIYSKFFKGSVPEFVTITVEHSGQVTYQEGKQDDNPLKFQLSDSDTRDMFALADKLDHFQRPLESGLKVANMGTKTFRFQDGNDKHEIQFNYSVDTTAQSLLDWFERITETEQNFLNLDRTVHYDKLGVNDVLLQLQITFDRKRVVAPQQFLPLLDRIAKNQSYLHISQERAAEIADAIRKPQPTPEQKSQP
jgi:hypothetical protein